MVCGGLQLMSAYIMIIAAILGCFWEHSHQTGFIDPPWGYMVKKLQNMIFRIKHDISWYKNI
jgi:hypothetical protein